MAAYSNHGRWTDNGGTSSGSYTTGAAGSGGVVTWSVAGAGLTNALNVQYADGSPWFTGTTVSLSSFAPSNYESLLRLAFAAWADVADIQFIETLDGGGNIGTGAFGTIRIGGARIDGNSGSNTLAATEPPGTGPVFGDLIFDSSNSWDSSTFFGVALHEIGHALGLDHVNNPSVVMNPTYLDVNDLQADDITSIRSLYGT